MSILTRCSSLFVVTLMASIACTPPATTSQGDRADSDDSNESEDGLGGSSSGRPPTGDGGPRDPSDSSTSPTPTCASSDPFAADGLRDAVTYLASPALGGRVPGSAGDQLARDFVAARFACLGLVAASAGGSYELPFTNNGGQKTANVAGYIKGTDAVVGSEIVVVGAHHDHFGTGGGQGLRLGANDNASGVAGMLATAQALATRGTKPRRTILFVAFGSEETATSAPFVEGSAALVKAMPPGLPLSKVVYMVNLDMVGTYKQEGTAYVIGSLANTPARPILDGLRTNAGLSLSLGEKGEEGDSDFYPFCIAGIPYAFFWTSDDACYHKSCDTADRLDYAEMGKIVKVTADLTKSLADTIQDLAAYRKNAAVSQLGCK